MMHGVVEVMTVDAALQIVRDHVAQTLAQLELAESDPQRLSDDELQAAKQVCLTVQALVSEDAWTVASRAARALLVGGDLNHMASFPVRVTAVTPTDLQRVARRWLANEPVIVVLKPQAATEGAH